MVALLTRRGYIRCIGGKAFTAPHTMTTSPLLSVGTFGVHVIGGASGWSFAGEVPIGIKRGGYATESDAIASFVCWFKSQDLDFQREHVADLRNDVFGLVLTA